MIIFLTILAFIISSGFSFLLGWGLCSYFKTFYNYVNYLRGKEEYKAIARGEVKIYAGSTHEALAIARMHQSQLLEVENELEN